MEVVAYIWEEVIIRPMSNSLVFLYFLSFGSFGLSIIAFTIIVRAAMIPLSIKQSRQIKGMSAIQPKVREIQAKYPNDRGRQSQETMRLYKEQGVNPLGCLGPMVIQMPIFIGLFWALRATLPSTPERLADLSNRLYSWLPQVNEAVPLNGKFLGMDLAAYSADNPLPYSYLLPLLVGGSMWIMQKMTATASVSPQQESTQRMMLWMMPIMFGYFTLYFESGLAVYWIISNVIGILIQGFITGWGPLAKAASLARGRGFGSTATDAIQPSETPPAQEEVNNEDSRTNGKNDRRGNRARVKGTRRRSRGSRNRRR